MTLALGRLVMGCSPSRLPAGTRHTSMSLNRSRPRPSGRGGRNLGSRYQQLESFIRSAAQKATLLAEMSGTSSLVEQYDSVLVHNGFGVPREDETFHGLVVPQEPKPPESDECCMSGCAVCIYDLYEDSLFTYKASLASLRVQLKSMGVPQSEWPPRVRSSPSSHASQRSPNTSLDAFEAMEKALKAKQQGRIEGDESPPKTHPPRSQFLPMLYEGMKWIVFSNR